jgi:hypothetical protein
MLEILKVVENSDDTSDIQVTRPTGGPKLLKRKRSDSAGSNTHPIPDAQRERY